MRLISRNALWTMLWALVLFATSCRADDAPGPIIMSAASDLANALPELTAAFEAESGVSVSATIGASGMLAQQIMNGAPVDVFASADRGWVDRLDSAQLILRDTRITYARGSLALVAAAPHGTAPQTLAELSDSSYRRIAIANPDVAPYGRAARQALQRAGVWDAVQPRIIMSETVRQALEYVTSGNVDVALVARGLLADDHTFTPVPAELHDPLHQDAVVIARSTRADAARRFVAFLAGDSGRAILQRHHFTLPERAP